MWKKALIGALLCLMVGAPMAGVLGTPEPPPHDIVHIQHFYDAVVMIRNWLYVFILVIVVILFLYAAFLFITAAGNEEKITTARKCITWGVVGIIVMIMAGGIVMIVRTLLEVQ